MKSKIIALLQDLYFDGADARGVLIRIGYRPAQIPNFRSAETFWPEVVLRLERGVVRDGLRLLLQTAAEDHPGSDEAERLLRELNGGGQRQAPAPGAVRVLCLFADPLRDSKLRLDQEVRLLQEIEERGGITVRSRHAVQVTDIIRAILREKPQIIHFAGHGGQNGRLIFERDGAPTAVGAEQLAAAIKATVGTLDCVVLNSCYTADNASAFRGATRTVAGSVTAIGDACALAFASGFYNGIAAGAAPPDAFATGCAEMELRRCDTSGMHFLRLDGEETGP